MLDSGKIDKTLAEVRQGNPGAFSMAVREPVSVLCAVVKSANGLDWDGASLWIADSGGQKEVAVGLATGWMMKR